MIKELAFAGYMCFREEHRLKLDALVYAILARREDDAERSNWLGKTTLLEIIRFVLYGYHRFRTDDEWISRGEPSGWGEIILSCGSRIKRTRSRGKRTNVYFYPAGGDATKPLIQAEADLAIEKLVGMSKFVTAKAEERMRIVSAWLQLDPLERCAANVARKSAAMEDQSKKIEGHLAAIDARQLEIEKRTGDGQPTWTRESMAKAATLIEESIEQRRGVLADLDVKQEKLVAAGIAKARREEFGKVVAEGKDLKKLLDGKNLPMLKTRWEFTRDDATKKAADKTSAERLELERTAAAKGDFDGKCPVAGIACPAREQINADRAPARALFDEAYQKTLVARTASREAVASEERARADLQEAQRLELRLEGMRDRAKKLQAESKAPEIDEDPAAIKAAIDENRGAMMEASSDRQRIRGWMEELERIETTRAELMKARDEIAGSLGTYREAAAIFGKRGAQRRVAEGVLGGIEADANAVLQECGAKLQVTIRWTREGKGIAKSCEQCGNPFPASAKVKTCERCGSPRGMALENKLEVDLSDRSGAAEDLAGVAVQLSASRWLRDQRGTTWSTAEIDEPFGALDVAHRKGLGRHLAAMLTGIYGFDQAFVVSHSPDATHALPGRIEIVSDGQWSTARVAA